MTISRYVLYRGKSVSFHPYHPQSLLLVAKILATEFGFVPDNTDQVTIQLHLHNLTHMMSLGYKEF